MDNLPPKVIYHCYSGYPPSLRAASAHLHRPLAAPRAGGEAFGRLILVGRGAGGEEVYTLGRRHAGAIAERALSSVARAFDVPDGGVAVVDAARSPGPDAAVAEAHHRLVKAALPRPIPQAEAWPKVVYVCYGSAHSSIVAANLHLGRLPDSRRAFPEELIAAPRFDQMPHGQIGTLLEMGQDQDGHRVYALGLGSGRDILGQTVLDFVVSLGLPESSILLVDALTGARVKTRIGGFLSRRLGLVRVGRPLIVAGILSDYDRFVSLVDGVRRRLARREFS